ncbi:hypothetical protein GCM10027275_43010 [Rhabdobacter roseus]
MFPYHNGAWRSDSLRVPVEQAVYDPSGTLWLSNSKSLFTKDNRQVIDLSALADPVTQFFWDSENQLYAATTDGLYWMADTWQPIHPLKGRGVHALVQDADSTLWVATSEGLWQRKKKQWINLDETLMAVGNERYYHSLALNTAGDALYYGAPHSIGVIRQNGQHEAWSGAHGLPYGPARVMRLIGEELWIGTTEGVIQKDTAWHYYWGKRWLPGNRVTDICEIAPGTIWVATDQGIGEISQQTMTLEEKAAHFADLIEKRHNRRGIINVSKLANVGDLATSYMENEDNDGLWTSCFLAAECYRYAATGSEEAKQRAIRTFEALERLETVTGIPGYPARSYALATDSVKQSASPHPKQWHPSPDGQWVWLDDTSSDEIAGHFFTLSLFHDLVADAGQKKRIVGLIDRIMTHIVENNYHLVDLDGKPTRWGVWNPDSLNHAPRWLYEKGLNSLQILSHLKTALHFTGNLKYETVYQKLVQEHGYAVNAVQAKQFGPFETSHSDDILTFFPYYGLFQFSDGDPNRRLYEQSLLRSWEAVRGDRMPVWNVMASAFLQQACDLEAARQELMDYPLDQIDWTMQNHHRWDLQRDPLVDRSGQPQALKPIPSAQSSVSRWNTNPKRLDSGNGGKTEETGTYFLFAYWMGRYYGYFD